MTERVIGKSEDLQDGGLALRFTTQRYRREVPAFAIRYQGRVYAYINECVHVPVELDHNPGHVFDMTGQYLVCSMHGAYYAPHDGICLGGPCRGPGLQKLDVEERDGQILIKETEA